MNGHNVGIPGRKSWLGLPGKPGFSRTSYTYSEKKKCRYIVIIVQPRENHACLRAQEMSLFCQTLSFLRGHIGHTTFFLPNSHQDLDKEQFNNYRPISNLSFISKIIEKVVTKQLCAHLANNNLYECSQSAYRRIPSTKTVLINVQSDVMTAVDQGSAV